MKQFKLSGSKITLTRQDTIDYILYFKSLTKEQIDGVKMLFTESKEQVVVQFDITLTTNSEQSAKQLAKEKIKSLKLDSIGIVNTSTNDSWTILNSDI